MATVEIIDLVKRYRSSQALRGIDLRFEPGRVSGVLGENGSGKSTLFRILAGVTRPTRGSVLIDGENVGVSVTRAFHYPPTEPWSEAEAFDLLERKLRDLNEATESVSEADAWGHALLHVIAYDADHADHIAAAHGSLPDEIKLDTLVFITTTEGDDEYVY